MSQIKVRLFMENKESPPIHGDQWLTMMGWRRYFMIHQIAKPAAVKAVESNTDCAISLNHSQYDTRTIPKWPHCHGHYQPRISELPYHLAHGRPLALLVCVPF